MNLIKHTALVSAIALAFASAAPLFAGEKHDPAPTRSAGQVIDDATITASVKTKLLEDERTQGFDINVDTKNGNVTLSGGADTLMAKKLASDLAMGVDGVVSVDNQLTVAMQGTETRQEANKATASGTVREIADETSDEVDDAWITGKVKSQLLADADVKGLDINVDTEDNIVKLTGQVPSVAARNEAIRIAETTKGVVRVNADSLVVR